MASFGLTDEDCPQSRTPKQAGGGEAGGARSHYYCIEGLIAHPRNMTPEQIPFKSGRCRASTYQMDSVLRQFSSRPRVALWACLTLVVVLSIGSLFPVDQTAGGSLHALLVTLCTPSASADEGNVGTAFAMWAAMSMAMMLPSAIPMLATYLDIAEAAETKSIKVSSPFLLAGGYAAVWLTFAAIAAIVQTFIASPFAGAGSQWASGVLFIAAGLYQFSPLKHACLAKCRQPMPYFLANWTDRPAGVLRMGMEEGLNCLGCCWAVMALAFAAGAMNFAWMAVIAALMMLEKVLPQPRALVAGWGLGLIGSGAVMMIAG